MEKTAAIVGVILSVSLFACTNKVPEPQFTKPTNPAIWPKLEIAVKKDPAVEERVAKLLAEMTLEQKVAQTIQPEIRDITVEDMRKYGFGSYLNGGGAFPNNDKHASVGDWVALAQAMYQASIDDSLDGSKIPTMWGTDAVHGHNNVIGATIFPHNIGLGAANNTELMHQIAEATAKEVLATGIDWIFAPTVAVARNDRWGRTYESYSEHPDIVRDYSSVFVKGLQGTPEQDFLSEKRVISTVKHFLGDGGTQQGDDQGNTVVSEQDLFDLHAQGYVGGLTAGAQVVMASFNSWNGKKIHGDQYLLTQVLKQQMGFDGFVVGDWNGHGQIPGCSNENCPQSMNAGLDMYMVPTDAWKPLYENLVKQVKSGEIPMSRLDDAVTRILRVKVRAGLFESASPSNRPYAAKEGVIGAAEHRRVAAQAVRESLVLLKNNGQLLPLSAKQQVLVAGDGAHNIGKQSGGWSITWQGTGNENSDFPGGTSIYDGIRRQVEAAGGKVTLSENGQFFEKPDVAIVVYGEEPYAEGNGDLSNLEFQRGNKRDLKLLKQLQAANIPVVSVFLSGRPLWVNAELNASNAFIAAWLPGSEGFAVAEVLFKDANDQVQHDFVGKLSFSWPNNPLQDEVNKDDDNYKPLFQYGYGLDYQQNIEVASNLSESYDAGDEGELSVRPLFDRSAKAPWFIALKHNGQLARLTSSVLEVPGLSMRTTDRRVQEDALLLNWEATSEAAFGLYTPFPEDLRDYSEVNAALVFDYKLVTNAGDLVLKMDCEGDCGAELTLPMQVSPQWQTISIGLTCLQEKGMDFGKVQSPFELSVTGQAEMMISDIRLQPNGEGLCP